MPNLTVADVFQIRSRFLRSAHLERDFRDATALNGYVLTEQVQANFKRLAYGLNPNSGQRAWRITGDYGSGKSSFALLLAHSFSAQIDELPANLQEAVDCTDMGNARPRLLPILTTGSNEPLAVAILRSLKNALIDVDSRGDAIDLADDLSKVIARAGETGIPDGMVVEFLERANTFVTSAREHTGLLIILDELGRFLEYAAMHPESQDVGLLQSLAEAACRSGKRPLFVVGLLHQGFNAYAEHLSQSGQREWEKVAGRFEELLFSQPLDQIALLVANALNIRCKSLSREHVVGAKDAMRRAVELGWYGTAPAQQALLDIAPRLYPLHPTVLPVLVRLFSRFGQNERSLFSFLLSTEEFGLQAFACQPLSKAGFYRLHHLFDYVRCVFGHRLAVQSYRSHWNQVDSMIQSFTAASDTEMQVLKTIGILNLLNTNTLLPLTDAVKLAVVSDHTNEDTAQAVLEELHKSKHVLHYRGAAGGYCLWPFTSVNLDRAYEDAQRAVGSVSRVVPLIKDYLKTNFLVARRHYIETGNLRHFAVHYGSVADLQDVVKVKTDSCDGLILAPLSENPEEQQAALEFAQSEQLRKRPEVVITVSDPLEGLAGLVRELHCWEWVMRNTPELNQDMWAAEEVSRQIAASHKILERRIHDLVGLQLLSTNLSQRWFHKAEPVTVRNRRELLSLLSDICNEVYDEAPRIANELVNRRVLSSAAAAARMRLIERMFEHPSEPLLGMPQDKKPPEMSMYLSVLKKARLHRECEVGYAFQMPDEQEDDCKVLPSLRRIEAILEAQPDQRVSVADIAAKLRKRPYGVRDGLIPILLAAFALAHEQDVAFYENGSFIRQVDGDEFLRLTKNPSAFEIQYCRVAGVRTKLFAELVRLLGLPRSRRRKPDILDVVKPLCVFVADLPIYSRTTSKLSAEAVSVRDALLKAREPGRLIFHDLPIACGFSAFGTQDTIDEEKAQTFVAALKAVIDELRGAYLELLCRIQNELDEAFGLTGSQTEARAVLYQRTNTILPAVKESRLRAFCERLRDNQLQETVWLEALASTVCSKPPSKWMDTDERVFQEELRELSIRFRRVECTVFKASGSEDGTSAVHLSIVQSDGDEASDVLYILKQDQAQVDQIEAEISSLFRQHKRLGMAAASRALWKALRDLDCD